MSDMLDVGVPEEYLFEVYGDFAKGSLLRTLLVLGMLDDDDELNEVDDSDVTA